MHTQTTAPTAYQFLPSDILIDASAYVTTHSKAPIGRGSWTFLLGTETVVWDGDYDESAARVIKENAARYRPATRIELMP